MRAFLLAIALAGCATVHPASLSSAPPVGHTTPDAAYDQVAVIQYMLEDTPAEFTAVTWEPCGFENAYFEPPDGPIVLCLEMPEYMAVAAAAHEAGHALVIEMGMTPRKTSPTDNHADERSADELSALFLIEMGRQADVVAAARYWTAQGIEKDTDDPHPPAQDRAWELLCLLDGSDHRGSAECNRLYDTVWNYWANQFVLHLPVEAAQE